MENEISGIRVPCGGEVHTALDGEPEGKRTLGRPSPKWEDSVKMDIREIRWKDVLRYE